MKIKILTIVGARPQIIKAAAISREIRRNFSGRLHEVILHTGQHYDANMSKVFFNQLEIPAPDYNLNVGSASHGEQTALMIKGIEDVILKEKPDAVILYGDTNSTLAGAVAASKLHVPVAHIEAGLRSFNKSMPEEINRIVCDHVSTWLFVPTLAGIQNLEKEGFDISQKPSRINSGKHYRHYTIDNPGVFHTGDVMYDNSLFFSGLADKLFPLEKLLKERAGFVPERFVLATIHRDSNTDDRVRINSIFRALADIAEGVTVIVPLHPRTSKILESVLEPELYDRLTGRSYNGVKDKKKGNDDADKEGKCDAKVVADHPCRVILLEPVSFLEMISLEKAAGMIITDSGGVQKEAFFFRKPSVILRPQTEWVEIVECGAAVLADADYDRIIAGFTGLSSKNHRGELQFPSLFGDGKAAEAILEIISAGLG